MRRFLSIITLALLLVFVLSSCTKIDMSVKLKADETGSVSVTLAITKEAYDMMLEMDPDNEPFDGRETFEMEEGGTTYIGTKVSKDGMSFDEITSFLLGEGDIDDDDTLSEMEPFFDSVEIEKSGNFLSTEYSFVATTISVKEEEDPEDDEFLDNLTKFTFTIEMPGEISNYSGGAASGNEITFSTDDFTEATTISVHSKEGVNETYIYIGFCAILLLLIIIFVIRRVNAHRTY